MAIERQVDNEEIDDLPIRSNGDSSLGSDSEQSSETTNAVSSGIAKPSKFKLILFVQQIISEIKKVVAPTRQELTEYTIVVLVFVLVIMLFITGADVGIGQIVMMLFAK